MSVDDIRAGRFDVPPLKKLKTDETTSGNSTDGFDAIEDDDLPFD